MAKRKTPSEIKVGVIGYGGAYNMGRSHLELMAEAGMKPTAVVEIDPARLEAAEADFPGIETYRSTTQMLKKSDVDLLTIITPHNTHAKLALQCLRGGRHVVCEKPLAVTTAECDAMIREARKRKVMLSTYHNRHWDGCVMEAVKRIHAGAIGEVVRVEAHMGQWGRPRDWWRSSRSISGGILYDWGVHLIEYAMQIVDDEVVEVSGYAHNGFWADQTPWGRDAIEDEGFAVMRFKSGAWLTLTVTQIDANPKRGQLEITGTKGSYVFDHGTWEILAPRKNGVLVSKGRNPRDLRESYYRNIHDHLTAGAPLVITPEWSRRPIHFLDLAVQSAKKGVSLKTKYR